MIFIVNPTLSTSLKQIESEGELINDGILGDEFRCLFLILIGERELLEYLSLQLGWVQYRDNEIAIDYSLCQIYIYTHIG